MTNAEQVDNPFYNRQRVAVIEWQGETLSSLFEQDSELRQKLIKEGIPRMYLVPSYYCSHLLKPRYAEVIERELGLVPGSIQKWSMYDDPENLPSYTKAGLFIPLQATNKISETEVACVRSLASELTQSGEISIADLCLATGISQDFMYRCLSTTHAKVSLLKPLTRIKEAIEPIKGKSLEPINVAPKSFKPKVKLPSLGFVPTVQGRGTIHINGRMRAKTARRAAEALEMVADDIVDPETAPYEPVTIRLQRVVDERQALKAISIITAKPVKKPRSIFARLLSE